MGPAEACFDASGTGSSVAKTLERALREQWPHAKIAKALSVDLKTAKRLLSACEKAIEVVDAD